MGPGRTFRLARRGRLNRQTGSRSDPRDGPGNQVRRPQGRRARNPATTRDCGLVRSLRTRRMEVPTSSFGRFPMSGGSSAGHRSGYRGLRPPRRGKSADRNGPFGSMRRSQRARPSGRPATCARLGSRPRCRRASTPISDPAGLRVGCPASRRAIIGRRRSSDRGHRPGRVRRSSDRIARESLGEAIRTST